MDKSLRNAIIAGIVIVVIAISYYLISKSNQKTEFDACYEQCVKDSIKSKSQYCVPLCGRKF